MSEMDVIEKTSMPITQRSIADDLRSIGVKGGMTLFVHSSLSSIGWVCGGPMAVLNALIESLGDEGTLVMPCMSTDNSDPTDWENPPVPEEWKPIIIENMPAFDKERSPPRQMGAIVDAFRFWPGAERSDHPISIVALGKFSHEIVKEQPWSFPLGGGSPLERCCDLGGYALLIGTERNTTLHLAEHKADFNKKTRTNGAAVYESGKRAWKKYEDYDDYTGHFPTILREFAKTGQCNHSKVGNADSYLFKQNDIVNFGIGWFERNLG